MADTSKIVDRVAARAVNRLTDPIEQALLRPRGRLSDGSLVAAFNRGERAALRMVEQAVQEQDLRVLAAKRPMEERLLDVAEESANATRCAVRPTGPGRQTTSAINATTQAVQEASVAATQGMVGADTVKVTDEILRAIETTPLKNPQVAAGGLPTDRAVKRALDEAGLVSDFSPTGYKVQPVNIADLLPREELPPVSELVVRYRAQLPVDPIVINADGVVLDGHHRLASAWASGRDRIFVVRVRGNKEVGRPLEWLRWNN